MNAACTCAWHASGTAPFVRFTLNQNESGGPMAQGETKVLTAHVPLPLAEKVDQMAARLERSRGWIMKQALSAWSDQEGAGGPCPPRVNFLRETPCSHRPPWFKVWGFNPAPPNHLTAPPSAPCGCRCGAGRGWRSTAP
ncbi:ribbon-helix-helix domain-containing protein [Chitiniphilus shinanonensis]|uniref:ribbon-helix-helix domain-containing protein n=1 Tax=Chitiniphilus shinanonensis TaxID=553088 RepID=UPI00333E2C16